MVTVTMKPVVSVTALAKELRKRGNPEEYTCELREIMFDDQFMNDVYKDYRFVDYVDPECYADKQKAKFVEALHDLLFEICPGVDSVLVDVSW